MRAAIYARYSSSNQREESIDAQVRAIQQYADREGHSIAKIYTDEARSATTDNRPEFQQMIHDSSLDLFDCIIVHKLDRFARDRFDSAIYKRKLRQNGVSLFSVLENIDGSPESIMLESVLEGMAEYYSKNLSREVMKGMRETAYQCKHTGGIPPLGYDVDSNNKYIINPIEAEAVRIIFDLYASGQGYSIIIDTLNDEGYKTKKGQSFSKNGLNNILKNEKYSGTYVFNRAASKSGGKRNNNKSKDDSEIIRVPDGMPAIISMEQWEQVSTRMISNKRMQASYKAKSVYVLSGLIYCGSCESAMLGNRAKNGRNKTEYAYYGCGGRKRLRNCSMKPIGRDFIDKLVVDTLHENVFSATGRKIAASKIYEFARAQRAEIPDYIKTMIKENKRIDKEISNIVNAIASGMFHESMKAKLHDLENEKAQLSLRLGEAEHQSQILSITKRDIENFLKQYSNIKKTTPAEQKNAVGLFVRRVTVYDDFIDIDFSPFGIGDNGPNGSTSGSDKPDCNDLGGDNSKGGKIGQGFYSLGYGMERLASTKQKPHLTF